MHPMEKRRQVLRANEAKAALDSALRKLLPRSRAVRQWRGEWTLLDRANTGRSITWPVFHRQPNNNFVAIASVHIGGSQWWVAAHYEYTDPKFITRRRFTDRFRTSSIELHFLILDIDPHTDPNVLWDEDPRGTQTYVASREELLAAVAA